MKWQVRQSNNGELYVDEDANDNATDGGALPAERYLTDVDIDIATALFLASRRWSQGSPYYPADAYESEAASLCDAILAYNIHDELHTPLLGDWCNRDDRENCKLYDATRSSDFILSSFLLFHVKHPDASARARWQLSLIHI